MALARVSGLSWLKELLGRVLLTPEVLAEALSTKELPDEQAIARALSQGWLEPLERITGSA